VRDLAAEFIAPLSERIQDQIAALIPDISEYPGGLFEPLAERIIDQARIGMPPIETLALPSLTGGFSHLVSPGVMNLPALEGLTPALDGFMKSIGERHATILEGLHTSIADTRLRRQGDLSCRTPSIG